MACTAIHPSPVPRRAEQPITIRAARRLALLGRDGRSQASIIEEALERMPLPPDAEAQLRAPLDAILEEAPLTAIPSAAAFDAREYDERYPYAIVRLPGSSR